ncbi:MAG: MerR family transcriptional regulator [Anaerolineaceae bacterium]|nr:MerR family transcriptional regulator [Anaerolineaceae bacterium]
MSLEKTSSEEPLYNIGVISRMTNIPETTLRVWERRYGFPEAARTAGGHRLYSQLEFLRLQWVKLRLDEGMQISQAIQALQHMEREGRFPEAPLSAASTFIHSHSDDPSLVTFRSRLVNALFELQTELADQIFAEALALHSVDTLLLDLISPTFAEIGTAWIEGRIDVAVEHFATHYLRHHLLMWMRTGPTAYHTSPVVLVCAPGDYHEGGLMILGVLLRRLRWPVIYLGASLPLPDLNNFIHTAQPAIVVFAATTETTALALAEWPQLMPGVEESGRPIVAFGGLAFTENPDLSNRVPGTYLGPSLQTGLEKLIAMLREINPLLH